MKIKDCLSVLDEEEISYEFYGNQELDIGGFSSIYNYKPNTMTWIRTLKNLNENDKIIMNNFKLVITPLNIVKLEKFETQIKVADPRNAFFTIIDRLWSMNQEITIHKSSIIPKSATIGTNVSIGAHCLISPQTIIGDNCCIGNNVTIQGKVIMGNNVIIQSGVVIGEDGFAYIKEETGLKHVPHFGGVRIGNNVSIGANSCIYRGTIDDTTLQDNVKISSLCHISHNCIIEENTQLVVGVNLMGSVKIGKNCWISTCVIRDQRRVGDNSIVGMGAVVTKDIPPNVTVIGNPSHIIGRKTENE